MSVEQVGCRLLGVTVTVQGRGLDPRPLLVGARPPLEVVERHEAEATVVVARDAGGRLSIEIDGASQWTGSDPAEAAAELEAALHAQVARLSSDPVFVHAGVVAWKGGALVLPGRTYSGKSTLVHALVAAGAGYMSDEYALIDAARGSVHAFPRPLALRGRGRIALPAAETGTHGLPVTLVAALRFDDREGLALTRITPGAAVLHLLDNTVGARRLAPSLMPLYGRVCEAAAAVAGHRGEAEAAAAALLALAEGGLSRGCDRD